MVEEVKLEDLTTEEIAAIPRDEIIPGIAENEAEVEAQMLTLHCATCNKNYWNAKEFRYTMCPHCGTIRKANLMKRVKIWLDEKLKQN